MRRASRGIGTWARGAALAASALAIASGARAADASVDDADASEDAVAEIRSERLTVRLAPGRAHLVDDLVIAGSFSAGPGEATLERSLPAGAVVTALRDDRGRVAELLPARGAERRYRHGPPGRGASLDDAVLASATSPGTVDLTVYPLLPGVERSLHLEEVAPTTYAGGEDRLELDGASLAVEHDVLVTVLPEDSSDEVRVGGRVVPAGATVRLTQGKTLELGLVRRGAGALSGELAAVPLGSGRDLLHLRVAAGGALGEDPKGAYVVVVVDASRSVRNRPAMLAAAAGYLEVLPDDARVQILTFDRFVHELEPGFVTPARAASDLRAAAFPPANGSEIGAALAAAVAHLAAAAPKGAPRRVLALSDLLTRSTLAPARVATDALAGAGDRPVVHLSTVSSGQPSLSRDDDDPWAVVARRTGGLVWTASADPRAPPSSGAATSAFSEWVRPKRIDRVAFAWPSLSARARRELALPDALEAGEGFEVVRAVSGGAAPRSIAVAGEVWSKRVSVALASDAGVEARWAGLATGADGLAGELRPSEVAELAWRGRVVSPFTSLLLEGPGRRPESSSGASSMGSIFSTASDDVGIGTIGTVTGRGSPAFDVAAFVRAQITPAWLQCAARAQAQGQGVAAHATFTVEATHAEIVDVRQVAAPTPDLARCVTDAAWEVLLPDDAVIGADREANVTL